MKKLQIGSIEIFWLNGGEFELDGGTMFGAVPKALWARKFPADADNYIRLLNAPLLIKAAGKLIIVDTGLGNKLTGKQKKIFRVVKEWNLPDDLAKLGIACADIDYVILSHCDFDHTGGVVRQTAAGKHKLTFPNAVHIVQKCEWDDVLAPNIRTIHTYWPENFAGLIQSGNLQIIDGDYQVVAGVNLALTGGHTRGHQLVEITSAGERALHLGDLFPTHAHANPLWIMAYDNYPLEVVAIKEKIIKGGDSATTWFTFYHDPFFLACRLSAKGEVQESISV